jgi:transposase
MVQRRHYPLSLKRKVVKEYLLTGITCRMLAKKYAISSASMVQKWMRQLGYEVSRDRGKPKFEPQIQLSLAKDKKQPTAQELQKKIRELERQLEDEKLRSEAFSRIIDKTEKELNISIRKKPNTR